MRTVKYMEFFNLLFNFPVALVMLRSNAPLPATSLFYFIQFSPQIACTQPHSYEPVF